MGQVEIMAPAPHTVSVAMQARRARGDQPVRPDSAEGLCLFLEAEQPKVSCTQVRNDIAWPTWSNSRVKLATAGFVSEGVALQFVRPQYSVIVLPFWPCPRRSLICMLK
jgi:hypothetical protein